MSHRDEARVRREEMEILKMALGPHDVNNDNNLMLEGDGEELPLRLEIEGLENMGVVAVKDDMKSEQYAGALISSHSMCIFSCLFYICFDCSEICPDICPQSLC